MHPTHPIPQTTPLPKKSIQGQQNKACQFPPGDVVCKCITNFQSHSMHKHGLKDGAPWSLSRRICADSNQVQFRMLQPSRGSKKSAYHSPSPGSCPRRKGAQATTSARACDGRTPSQVNSLKPLSQDPSQSKVGPEMI